MEIGHGLIAVSFYFILFYSSVFSQKHGHDPTQEPAFYCLGYANCTGSECHYNRMSPVSGSKPFKMSDKAELRCDSLEVDFTFPDSKDESFVGNETWTCFRYYDGVGHHFALLKITLNKPKDVIGHEVKCSASIGDCTPFHETPSEMVFVAGLPNSCVKWTEDTETWLPEQNQTVNCPHYQKCDENTCHFNGTRMETVNKHFFPGEWTIFICGSLKVEILVPVSNDSNYIGNKTYSCFEYVNEKGVMIPAAEVHLTKPDGVKGSQFVCTFDGNICRLQNETDSQVTLVAGFPSSCTPWVPPTPPPSSPHPRPPPPPSSPHPQPPPPADKESWLPAQNQIVDCPHYQNCDENTCQFNGTYIVTTNKHFFSGEWTLFTCGLLKVEILVPVSNESNYIGNKTYSCFEYGNGNGANFPAAEVILTKPDDVKGSDFVCTFGGNKCRLQNETDSQITLVAGFPSSCTLWNPPTPPAPETTIAAPETTSTPESTVSGSDEPSPTVSNTTAGSDITTESTDSSSQASNTSTSDTSSPAPDVSTNATSSPGGETTTPKGGTNVARLESVAVLAVVVALYIRKYQ